MCLIINNLWTKNVKCSDVLRVNWAIGQYDPGQCLCFWLNWIVARLLSLSFPTPELEGRSNLTSLDIQIKKLRDSALTAILNGVRHMREESMEIRDTLSDIECWADKLQMLAEEVQTQDWAFS